MWFWEAVERRVQPAVDLDRARQILAGAGFIENAASNRHLLFTRPGSPWTPDTAKTPVKIGIADGNLGLYLLLKYQSVWPSLKSKELESLADKLCRLLCSSETQSGN